VSRAAALVALALTLAGCGMFDRGPPPPCPRFGILGEAATVVKFRPGEGRDLTDVEHQAEILNVSRSCETGSKGAVVEAALVIEMAAARGPAAPEAAQIQLPFFIAVVERTTQRIVSRENVDGRVDIPPGRRRAGSREEITQRIPLPGGKGAADYEILVGFNLTAEQLDYNRRQRGF
jgi:hypothetical protein